MIFSNKYTIIGLIFIILGIFLMPFLIGFPIMITGFFIAGFGLILEIIERIPGLKEKIKKIFLMIKESYKPYFNKNKKN